MESRPRLPRSTVLQALSVASSYPSQVGLSTSVLSFTYQSQEVGVIFPGDNKTSQVPF
jgi:hypothetical protein